MPLFVTHFLAENRQDFRLSDLLSLSLSAIHSTVAPAPVAYGSALQCKVTPCHHPSFLRLLHVSQGGGSRAGIYFCRHRGSAPLLSTSLNTRERSPEYNSTTCLEYNCPFIKPLIPQITKLCITQFYKISMAWVTYLVSIIII